MGLQIETEKQPSTEYNALATGPVFTPAQETYAVHVGVVTKRGHFCCGLVRFVRSWALKTPFVVLLDLSTLTADATG